MKFPRKLLIQMCHDHFFRDHEPSFYFLNTKDKIMAWPQKCWSNASWLCSFQIFIDLVDKGGFWEVKPSLGNKATIFIYVSI